MKRYLVQLAADRAVRDILGGRQDQLGLRGQQVQRASSSGHQEPPAELSSLGLWDLSRWDGADRYS